MEQKQPNEETLLESQKHYSDDGLWDKMKSVFKKAGIKVIYLALVLYYTVNAESTPTAKKGIIYGALGYFILPIDLIPDAIPIAGFSDDLAALVACVAAVSMCITPEIKAQAETKLKDWFGEFDQKEIKGLIK